jgi:hypothetical protein
VSPSRRDPDVLRLPGTDPPAEHPLAALDPGKRKGRRRRAPQPAEEDPRDRMMLAMLEQIQTLNGQVAELGERLQLALIRVQLNHRRLEALEAAAAGPQEPPGAIGAASDGESAAGAPRTP